MAQTTKCKNNLIIGQNQRPQYTLKEEEKKNKRSYNYTNAGQTIMTTGRGKKEKLK